MFGIFVVVVVVFDTLLLLCFLFSFIVFFVVLEKIHIRVGILDGDDESQGFWRPVSFKVLGRFHSVSLDCCVENKKMQQWLCDF